ncbi:coronin-7-like isoform X1 [Thamnophis elegans]|uniref:coronin-7-like isoform X1 n=1 Tax=Thamnophis elegans TaxID=35005 RepID=UPI0013773977|nr:coronin-7-like isoform X1 [Thamnophis elegans]
MSLFRVSKFRHAEAKVARKEAWIGGFQSSGPSGKPHIKANARWIAFSTDLAGVLGAVALESPKGIKRVVSHLHCHSGVVTDFDFSPFDQQLLATGAADEAVKVWRLLESGQDLSSSPHVTLGPEGSRVEVLLFHPTADGVLASAAGKAVTIWDVEQQQILTELEPHLNWVQSLAWKPDGSLLGTSCQDKRLHIFDPRAKSEACQTVLAHRGGREVRLLWVNADGCFLSVGSNQMMEREVCLWDSRRLNCSLTSVTLDASPKPLIPLFDLSSGLLVLAGKGEKGLFCYEVQPAQPAVVEVHQSFLETRTQGAAQVPRLALNVTACEVMRVLQLSDSAVVPISYLVPRKATHEFHKDLFPDGPGNVPAASARAWWAGDNTQVEMVSLDPAHRPSPGFLSPCLPRLDQDSQHPPSAHVEAGDQAKDPDHSVGSSLSSPGSSLASPSSVAPSLPATGGFSSSPSQRSLQNILGPSSAFRHIEGVVLPRTTHITNLRGLSLTTPGECDGFCANQHRIAIPLLATGGQVAILELSQPGRLPDTPMPTIQNGAPISDLCWDPFDEQRLAIAGEDTKIRLWRVEPTGLQKQLLEPEVVLRGHTEKIYSIKFHPLASDVLASSSYDKSVRIWDVRTGRQELGLQGHTDQIFSLAWSPNGRCLATVSKDGRVRVYEPRQAAQPLQDGPGPKGGRGARVTWVCGGQHLLVSGFDSRSERQLSLHQAEALAAGPLATIGLDVSPSTLIPFYDVDTSVAFFTGKGDTRVFVYEVVPEAPFFLECNSFLSCDPHKGFHFLPKTACDVREVEIARALRLRQSSIEPVAFRVPRVKKEFFQDDLFPATQVWWEPALPATAWLKGANKQHRITSLQPKDMTPVSQAPKETPKRKYLPSSVYLEEKSDEQKKEELLSAMVAKLGNRDDPLPQDSFEGVDEEEWD